MTSIIRPAAAQKTRRLIVMSAAIFAVVVAYGQMALGWGQTPGEFAADGDATLRVAGYAFSIWGVIYLGLLAYAVRQVLPATGESDMLTVFGWPSVAALLGIGWWIVASAADWKAATVVLIFASAAVLIVPLAIQGRAIRALSRRDRDLWLTIWPLALLAGWLTIAAPVNLLTVATSAEALPAALPPTGWAIVAVVAVVAAALLMTARLRISAYALPIAWGLVGVFAAEQARNPTLAFAALGAAGVVLVGAVILVFRLRPGVERAA